MGEQRFQRMHDPCCHKVSNTLNAKKDNWVHHQRTWTFRKQQAHRLGTERIVGECPLPGTERQTSAETEGPIKIRIARTESGADQESVGCCENPSVLLSIAR